MDNFKPFPKNPTIAKFFMQLGRFDELGSGVLNKGIPKKGAYYLENEDYYCSATSNGIVFFNMVDVEPNKSNSLLLKFLKILKSQVNTGDMLSRHEARLHF